MIIQRIVLDLQTFMNFQKTTFQISSIHKPLMAKQVILLMLLLLCFGVSFGQAQTQASIQPQAPATTGAIANELRIGIILSQTGPQSGKGAIQAGGFDLLAAELAQGWFGLPIKVFARDDQSQVSNTLALANVLVRNDEVHVIICCSSQQAASMLAQNADILRTPILSLSHHPSIDSTKWMFSIAAPQHLSLERMLIDVKAMGLRSVAIMSSQPAVQSYVQQEAARQGLELRVSQGYDVYANNLMPEALFVASKQAEAVIVWDNDNLVSLAYTSLRERGYEGAIYVPNPQLPDQKLIGARLVPRTESFNPFPQQIAYQAFSAYRQRYTANNPAANAVELATAAYTSDTIQMLREGATRGMGFMGYQSGYNIQLETWPLRLGIRDGLVSTPQRVGAHGLYHFTEDRHSGLLPESFPILEYIDGQLVVVR